ncbi:zinc-binding protein A33-like [Alosa pseudoharengus]|uniref:zinc-binding protein A33-like n=1 Tax=Alosa pseudoharengus TaxID=34774 RepID=UPI003F8CDFF1
MESKRPYLVEDLSCPVCQDIFKSPVMLTCSHSVCKECLTQFWESKGVRECPLCRKRSSNDPPLLNLILKNVCEAFLHERSSETLLCSRHNRKLELYCLEDNEPVCLVCRDSEKHQQHNFSPISEIAAGLREKVMAKLQAQKNNMKDIQDFKLACNKMAEHITRQVLLAEQNMKEEFEKLHQFLREEQAARIAALRQEEEMQARMMNLKIEDAITDILEFTERIRDTEQDLASDDAFVVLIYGEFS